MPFFLSLIFAVLFTADSQAAEQHAGYIVKLNDHSAQTRIKRVIQRLSRFNQGKSLRAYTWGSRTYVLLNAKLEKHQQRAIAVMPEIAYIEPNFIVSGFETLSFDSNDMIEDKNFRSQWGFHNTGKNNWIKGQAGIDIAVVEAWKKQKGSPKLRIAVIDSGVETDHPDLQQNLWQNKAELAGLPGVDDDNNGYVDDVYGYDFVDDDGIPNDVWNKRHGTRVAGLIGATHNEIGIRGVMAHVEIISLKFLNSEGKGEAFNAVKCIHYAIEKKVKILNNSWGSYNYSEAVLEAIETAREAGILFVAAAGNSNSDNDLTPIYPASYDVDNVIAVGDMTPRDKKASYSNYGKQLVHLFAPGWYSVAPGGKYGIMWGSGTSFAAPLVSGALGLLLSASPSLSYREAKAKLIASTTPSAALLEHGQGGRLNISKMFE